MRTLHTDRLVLRPWEPPDAPFLLDLEGRWEVVRYLGADPTTLSSIGEAAASIDRRRAISQHEVHGIWLISTAYGEPVGNLLLKPIPRSTGTASDASPEIEIGWHLHPDAWGNGYATEAASAVIGDAFERGLKRIIAVTAPENVASQAVCRRLGMRSVGRTRAFMDTECELFVISNDPD